MHLKFVEIPHTFVPVEMELTIFCFLVLYSENGIMVLPGTQALWFLLPGISLLLVWWLSPLCSVSEMSLALWDLSFLLCEIRWHWLLPGCLSCWAPFYFHTQLAVFLKSPLTIYLQLQTLQRFSIPSKNQEQFLSWCAGLSSIWFNTF